jgi:hypothetical protein
MEPNPYQSPESQCRPPIRQEEWWMRRAAGFVIAVVVLMFLIAVALRLWLIR